MVLTIQYVVSVVSAQDTLSHIHPKAAQLSQTCSLTEANKGYLGREDPS